MDYCCLRRWTTVVEVVLDWMGVNQASRGSMVSQVRVSDIWRTFGSSESGCKWLGLIQHGKQAGLELHCVSGTSDLRYSGTDSSC